MGFLAFLRRLGHVLITDAKMPHFEGKNEMEHFGIGMHIHASDLSQIGYLRHIHFGAFWQPSCISFDPYHMDVAAQNYF